MSAPTFRPTRDRLAPELTTQEEIVLLARALWNEGYNDHLSGHITVNMGDGTFLGSVEHGQKGAQFRA